MTVIALVSAKSSGVTTSALALALASPRPTLLAECDPAGGTIRSGFLGGQLNPHVGLGQLGTAERQGPEQLAAAFEQQLRPLDARGDRQLLAGLTDPRQAAALTGTWPALSQMFQLMSTQAGYDVIIDAGRVVVDAGQVHPTLSPAALLQHADVVLLVVHSWLDSLAAAQGVAELLRAELSERGTGADALGVLLVESGPERVHRVAQALALPVLGALPWDEPAAQHLARGTAVPRGFTRSKLMRAARSACGPIEELAQRRKVRLSWPTQAPSPVVAGVLQRLQARGVPVNG
ncbi:MinD/ParA family ATP-binding protein [Streptomyces sp. NPDC054933]